MELLHPATWHDHDIDFARWLHPAMWHVALESWQWIHQVAAPCNVIRGSGMTCCWIRWWQHPVMWQVALGWHAVEFAQTSAILAFYIWFRVWPYHPSRHVILHQSAKFYPNRTTLSAEKNHVMSIFKMADLSHFSGPIMGSLKSPCTTSYRSTRDKIALNCLVFEKIAFLYFIWWQIDKQTNKQADRRTNGQHRCTKPLSVSRAAAI